MIPWTEDLDLSIFYQEAEKRGFKNNSSKKMLVDSFRNEKEWSVWILYYNDDGKKENIINFILYKSFNYNQNIGVPYWHDHISGESVWANQSSEEGILYDSIIIIIIILIIIY